MDYASRTHETRCSREELIRRALPIVRRLAFRMARRLPPNVEVGDLIGAGNEGLVKAADSYDPRRHPRFEAYAELRIRGAILDELRVHDTMTRHGRRRLAEVSKVIRELSRSLGRQPTEEEVARALDLTVEKYRKLTESLARGPALGRAGESEPDAIGSSDLDPMSTLHDRRIKERVAEAIRGLPERSQLVLALYYQEECTQAEIGRILGVTESRVCQILGDCTARLRAALGVSEVPAQRHRRPRVG